MTDADRLMDFAERIDALPAGAGVERVGRPVTGPGGAWVPFAARVGPLHWFASVGPGSVEQGGRAVALAVPFTDPATALAAAEKLAAIAAGPPG